MSLPFLPVKRTLITKPQPGVGLGNSSIASGISGAWLFNEGSGNTLNDITGNQNTGTFIGTPGPVWTEGRFGRALKFDGATGAILIANGNNQPSITSSATISVWVKLAVLNATLDIFGQYSIGVGNTQNFGIQALNSAKFQMAWNLNGITSISSILTFAWTHLVAVRSGKTGAWTGTLYINGAPVASASTATDPTNLGSYYIGCNSLFSAIFNGLIDNAVLWNRALSNDEVARLYSEPFCFMANPKSAIIRAKVNGGGNIYNNSLTESFTLTDSEAFLAAMEPPINENFSLNDSYSPADIFNLSDQETLTFLDSQTAGFIYTNSLTEIISLSDNNNQVAGMNPPVIESGTLTDSQSILMAGNPALTEAMTLTDSAATSVLMGASLLEIISLTDTALATAIIAAGITETVVLADGVAFVANMTPALSDAITLTDSATLASASNVFNFSITESIGLADIASTISGMSAAMHEAIGLSDFVNVALIPKLQPGRILDPSAAPRTESPGIVTRTVQVLSAGRSLQPGSGGRIISLGRKGRVI